MAELSNRTRLYQKINDNLSEDDVRSLRAMLISDQHLGRARVENATPQEICNMLEADNKIGRGNLALLVELLKALGKTKLAKEAEEVARGDEAGGTPYAVEDVITCLKNLYSTEYATVRPLPWCEDLNLHLGEVYTNLQLQRRDDRGRFEDTGRIVSLADIYNPNETKAKTDKARSSVRRIRVEGPPGIGKSCSCQKLAYDWSSGKLDLFRAVFFLEMRNLSGKVKDAIFEQLLPKDTKLTPDQLWSYIQENQDDILFILDGLDERSQNSRKNTDVVDLIQGKILRNCHVLVTSRPYHCVHDLEKCHEFYKIVGYSKENSNDCIRKYFRKTPESAAKLMVELERSRYLTQIVVNPLNNVLICVVWEDSGEKLPKSKAELYTMIVNSVTKRCCKKKRLFFQGDKFPPNIEAALRGLGKLSWEGLQQDQLQFNIDDIREEYGTNAEEMLDMGLLTRDYSFSRIQRTCYCAFLHKTFQEYMAAYYISGLVMNKSSRKEGVECLRRLFGMTEGSDVDMGLIATSHNDYREVQDLLLLILGENSGPLFEMFAEKLKKAKSGGKVRDLLSFVCILCLGRTCGGSDMAEIVAPYLSEHITNHVDYGFFSSEGHVEWIDGLTQVLNCQKKLAMSHETLSIHRLTFDFSHLTDRVLQQHQVDMLEHALSDSSTIYSVNILNNNTLGDDHAVTREGQEFSPVRMFVPRCGTQGVSIHFKITQPSGPLSMVNMVEDLSGITRLEHVDIDIRYNYSDTDFSEYDRLLALMITKQSCLKSLRVKIGVWVCESTGVRGFGNLTATLQSISKHTSLQLVELKHPVDECSKACENVEEYKTVDVEAMGHKLTQCLNQNNVLKTLKLCWITEKGCTRSIRFMSFKHTIYKPTCSGQSLSSLCSAIQRNRTLETLTIDGMFAESEGHGEIIDQLMLNKPSNFQELTISMWKSMTEGQKAEHMSTDRSDSHSTSSGSGDIEQEQDCITFGANSGVSEPLYKQYSNSSTPGNIDQRSEQNESSKRPNSSGNGETTNSHGHKKKKEES